MLGVSQGGGPITHHTTDNLETLIVHSCYPQSLLATPPPYGGFLYWPQQYISLYLPSHNLLVPLSSFSLLYPLSFLSPTISLKSETNSFPYLNAERLGQEVRSGHILTPLLLLYQTPFSNKLLPSYRGILVPDSKVIQIFFHLNTHV